ncbi:hypothetical protein [Chryseobacterium flavum]|uniref:hypothetical protein n=1 Tax=Chryseobacterium flavum TaxID=415851 RepID=UPI0028A5F9A8|nr:hypothetical protein [Chryseobacterium flavum]
MITYMTLPGDTLEKIAADLKVENPVYLKEFHNTYCARHNRLAEPVQLYPGTLLHIPFGDEINILNQQINDRGDSLYYHPPHGKMIYQIPLLGGAYTIRHQKYQDGILQAGYQYQTELKYLRAEKNDHFFSLQIFGSGKDGMESDSKMAGLAKACAAILFPVEIRVNSALELTDVKFYHPESAIKNELDTLKKYFTDNFSASYIDQMKKKVEDRDHTMSSIRQTLPVHFLFGSFYRAKYSDWTDSGIYHDFIPWLTNASPIRFELYNRILPKEQNAADKPLKIIQSGKSCDYRNLTELYDKSYAYQEQASFNSRSVSCSHEAEYIFDRTNLVIKKITGSFEIQIGDVTEKDVVIMEKQ